MNKMTIEPLPAISQQVRQLHMRATYDEQNIHGIFGLITLNRINTTHILLSKRYIQERNK